MELDSLSFLMDTSFCKEHSKKYEDVARRKEMKEKEARSGNSSTDSVNSGSGPDYQFYKPLLSITVFKDFYVYRDP
jgi:hypothetical protein